MYADSRELPDLKYTFSLPGASRLPKRTHSLDPGASRLEILRLPEFESDTHPASQELSACRNADMQFPRSFQAPVLHVCRSPGDSLLGASRLQKGTHSLEAADWEFTAEFNAAVSLKRGSAIERVERATPKRGCNQIRKTYDDEAAKSKAEVNQTREARNQAREVRPSDLRAARSAARRTI